MLGIRVTPEMKRRVMDAAAESGRSLSQQAEIMLEMSLAVSSLKEIVEGYREREETSRALLAELLEELRVRYPR